jgi:hypothetical protein
MVVYVDMSVRGVLHLTFVFHSMHHCVLELLQLLLFMLAGCSQPVIMSALCCVVLHVVLQALREVDPPSFQQLFSRKDVQVRINEG